MLPKKSNTLSTLDVETRTLIAKARYTRACKVVDAAITALEPASFYKLEAQYLIEYEDDDVFDYDFVTSSTNIELLNPLANAFNAMPESERTAWLRKRYPEDFTRARIITFKAPVFVVTGPYPVTR